MKPTSYRSLFALATFGLPASLSAQIAWDGTGDGTTYEDGSNWVGDAAPANDLVTDIAQLTGSSVNLSTSRQVNGLDLNASSTLLGGGSLEIGAGGLSGTEDLTISGTTSVDLNGTESSGDYTGDIFIGAGATLSSERTSLMQTGAFAADTFITLDGGTLSQSNNHLDLTGRDIILGAGGGTLRHIDNRNIFGGYLISGTGALTLEGANTDVGRVQLTEANTYTGGTIVKNGAQAWLYNNNSFGAADTAISLESGGKLYFAANHDFGQRVITMGAGGGIIDTAGKSGQVRAGVLGSDDLRVDGGGLLEWYADSSAFTGDITVDEGTEIRVRTSAADMLGTGVITLDNGAFIKNRNNSFNINNDIVLGSGGGGIEVGWANRTITVNGDISGAGQLGITNDSSSTRIRGNNTYTGGTLIQARLNVDNTTGLGTGKVTLDNVNGEIVDGTHTRGWLQNRGNDLNITGGLEVTANGGAIKAGWSKNITISGVFEGTGQLVVEGDSGTIVASNVANTFSGEISLRDATSRINVSSLGAGAVISGAGEFTVAAGGEVTLDSDSSGFTGTTVSAGTLFITGALGGDLTTSGTGTVGGTGALSSLTLDAGATFLFSETDTITVVGLVTLDSTFGVDDLEGIGSGTTEGVYTLIDNAGDFSYIENFGVENSAVLGGNKYAYFQNGSLQLVVIPEPSIALLGGLGLLGIFRRRRI
ncbi:beta strand repeat-containing protein [Haloferula sp.]|uniref:beta strand repeat-containing protein n=1 Tax=Haloferula sp. TaxID=2497595 RepID=UPI00329E2313